MMGRGEGGQGQFFYAFDLDEVVPRDHLVRQIDAVLDLNWVHKELAPHYSHTGRPSNGERHLWVARKGGVPRGVSILTRGSPLACRPPPTLNPTGAQQLITSAGCTTLPSSHPA